MNELLRETGGGNRHVEADIQIVACTGVLGPTAVETGSTVTDQ